MQNCSWLALIEQNGFRMLEQLPFIELNGVRVAEDGVSQVHGAYKLLFVPRQEIRYLSFHDKLTGLYNRPYVEKAAQELIQHQQRLRLDEHITWTGYRSDVREFYAIASLVFSLSKKPEAFGRTIAESLAIGTPVVAWDHGGAREIMLDSFPAGLIPAHNSNQLLCRVLQLLDMPDRPHVGDVPMTQSAMISGTLDVYSEMMNERVRRAA